MTERDLVARSEVGTRRLSVYYDEGGENPREWSNLGTMVCWHRRYDLGDTHGHDTPYDFWFELLVKLVGDTDDAEEWVAKAEDDWSEANWEDWVFVQVAFQEVGGYEEYVILPLYLYDHSGVTMNTVGFHCSWDSGPVGWIYCSRDKFRKETGYTEDELFSKDKHRAEDILVGEVETFDTYIRGEVYGYIIEERETCSECGHTEWKHVDSCWGFYGRDWNENGLFDSVGDQELADALETV